MYRTMCTRHVFRAGAVRALLVTAGMAGYPLHVALDRNSALTGLHFDLLLYQVVRH